MRIGQSGHLTTMHLRTSDICPPLQSMHFARIAAIGLVGPPRAQRSDDEIFPGDFPTKTPPSASNGEGSR